MAFPRKVQEGDVIEVNTDGRAIPCPGCGRTTTSKSKIAESELLHYCIYCKAEWIVRERRWRSPVANIRKGNEKWYQNWQTVRKEALTRSNGHCEMCKTETRRLQLHHKKPPGAWGGDTLGNLIALCDPCHNEAHRA